MTLYRQIEANRLMHSKALARKQRLESRCRGIALSTIGSAAGFAAPTFRIADSPQPDDACQRPHSGCGIRPYRCTKNMYLIRMCWLRGAGTAKTAVTGADRRTMAKFGVHPGIRVFPGPPLPLGAIQR